MINGFENETHELTPYERTLVRPMVRGLQNKVGKENAIKNAEMIAGMERMGTKIGFARVRKIIHHIRVNQLVPNLVATSSGYYIENNPERLKDYVESLDQRINSITEVRDSYNLPGAEKR